MTNTEKEGNSNLVADAILSPVFTSFTDQSLLTAFLPSVQYQVSTSKRSRLQERQHHYNRDSHKEYSTISEENRGPQRHGRCLCRRTRRYNQESCKRSIRGEPLHTHLPHRISIDFDMHSRCYRHHPPHRPSEGSIANL